ncbi:MAG: MmcQ-like protein [Flavobacterium sp. BFFFF2]|nr:MAG: MmcQ-like protein [Flavobacterium sp. BFFFF2]
MIFTIQDLYDYCQDKPGVTEHFPFDEDTLVFKVGGKMFCLTSLLEWEKGTPSLNLKCDPERAEELRAEFSGITPGYHMSKVHWNTVSLTTDVDHELALQLIDESYDLVFESLTAKAKAQIDEEHA